MRKGKTGNARKYIVNESFFDSIDNEYKAYWLGFISADGCIQIKGNTKRLSIQLMINDYAHLMKFVDCLDSDYPVHTFGKVCTLVITSNHMCNSLIRLGVTPRKSKTLITYKKLSKDLERHYWRGFVDGDGCIHKRNDGFFEIMLVGTFDVCQSFSNWIKSIGIKSKANVNPIRTFYGIRYNGNKTPKSICSAIYKNSKIYLDRKYDKCIGIMSI